MLAALNASNHGTALAFAMVPEQVCGYGHVEAWHLAATRTQWNFLLQCFHPSQAQAA